MENPETTFLFARHSKKEKPDFSKEFPGISGEGEQLVRERTRDHLMGVIEHSEPGSVILFAGASDVPRTKSTTRVSVSEIGSLLADKTDDYLVYDEKTIDGMVDKKTESTRSVLSKTVAENPDKKIVISYPLFLNEFSLVQPDKGPRANVPDWKTGGVKEVATPFLTELMKQANNDENTALLKWVESAGKLRTEDGKELQGPNPTEVAKEYVRALERLHKIAQELFPGRPLVIEATAHSWDIDVFIAYATHGGKVDAESFTEIAHRLHLSRYLVQFMLKDEVRSALLDHKVDKILLIKRLKHCVLYVERGFEQVYVGSMEQRLKNTIVTKIDKNVREITGQTAQPGFARGVVKIIFRARDMGKMNRGDILVSVATDPDVVPAMKKAGAIVTEQGGITSHAAIVSRELGIPCIIGTKIATKVLKDGDRVEVDATKGLVKKV